jgi:hypothetical protein
MTRMNLLSSSSSVEVSRLIEKYEIDTRFERFTVRGTLQHAATDGEGLNSGSVLQRERSEDRGLVAGTDQSGADC